MPLLSAGFWNGTAEELTLDAVPHRPIVAADRLVVADDSLANGSARVTVHGFWRAKANRDPLTLGLLARYPACDVPVITWVSASGQRVSNRARFEVPVAETLDFTVERLHHRSRTTRRITDWMGLRNTSSRTEVATMSPRTGSSGIKLRRGVYFLAIRENEREAIPSWSSMQVVSGASAGSKGPLASAPFSYLMLSIA